MSEQLPELDPDELVDETDVDWEDEPAPEDVIAELDLDEMGNPKS